MITLARIHNEVVRPNLVFRPVDQHAYDLREAVIVKWDRIAGPHGGVVVGAIGCSVDGAVWDGRICADLPAPRASGESIVLPRNHTATCNRIRSLVVYLVFDIGFDSVKASRRTSSGCTIRDNRR